MAYKIVAIFVVLVSWSTMLYASQGCQNGNNVPKNQYTAHMQEIARKVSQPFTESDITCLKVISGFGSGQNYCAELSIAIANGRKMTCTVKWGNFPGCASSSVCSSNGANVVTNGSGSSGVTIGGSGNGGSGNGDVKNAMQAMKRKFSNIFKPGFPFSK